MKPILIFLLSFLFMAFKVSKLKAQVIHYVTPTGAGLMNGSSWTNASANLQNMIDASMPNDEVWVAAGTYKPGLNPNGNASGSNRNYTFLLKNHIKIYGGFIGNELLLSQRNYTINTTILSGDFNDDDITTGSGNTLSIINNTENAYHVVVSISDSNNTILDGFTIKGGYSDWNNFLNVGSISVYGNKGGGMYNISSNPTISNCSFIGNLASLGGGMYNESSNPTINNCSYISNSVSNSGGGIYTDSGNPFLSNCLFIGNTALWGGGIANGLGNSTLNGCSFIGNTASNGGGMINYPNSNPIITNCTFAMNSASNLGGGIYSFSNPIVLNNCILSGNSSQNGGGMYNLNCNLQLSNCTFDSNSASGNGGGMHNESCDTIELSYCTINNNSSSNHGGGIFFSGGIFKAISNCIFNNNSTSGGGGGIWGANNMLVNNCSFSNNSAGIGGAISISGTPQITNTTFNNNSASMGGAINADHSNIILDSCIFNYNVASSDGGGIYNFIGSPSIAYCSFTGNTASHDGGGIYNRGDEPTFTYCLFSNNSAAHSGGGLYNNTSNPIINHCVFTNNSGANSGGAIYNFQSAPWLSNDTFSFNSSTLQGGAMFNDISNIYSTAPSIIEMQNCYFNNNSSGFDGGCMYNQSSDPVISNCMFTNNTSNHNGGGIYNDDSSPIIEKSIFKSNHTNFNGGAIYSKGDADNLFIANCVFSANSSGAIGGAIFDSVYYSHEILHCTLTGNSANDGGAIAVKTNNLSIANCIVWGNSGITNSSILYSGTTSFVSYSMVQGGFPGIGNNGMMPLFINASDPDGPDNIWRTADDGLGLQSTSQAINTSNPTTILPLTDITGFTRNGIFDRGAYEFQGAALPVEGLKFSGKEMNGSNLLNWLTLSENNSSHFEIERSADALSFEKIGSVKAAGNSNCLREYSFNDTNPFHGINYYRLKQVDIDEKFIYSNVVVIKNEKVNQYAIFPNPVQDKLFVYGLDVNTNCQIIDGSGRTIVTCKISPNQFINLEGLKNGVYYLKINNKALKFIKE